MSTPPSRLSTPTTLTRSAWRSSATSRPRRPPLLPLFLHDSHHLRNERDGEGGPRTSTMSRARGTREPSDPTPYHSPNTDLSVYIHLHMSRSDSTRSILYHPTGLWPLAPSQCKQFNPSKHLPDGLRRCQPNWENAGRHAVSASHLPSTTNRFDCRNRNNHSHSRHTTGPCGVLSQCF